MKSNMMKIKILFVFLSFLFVVPQGYATLGQGRNKKKSTKKSDKKSAKKEKDRLKKEMKLWKNRAKKYVKAPLSLKKLVDAKREADEQAGSALSELNELKSSIDEKDMQIAKLRDASSQVDGEILSLREQVKKMKQTAATSSNSSTQDYSKGVVFKVQIGSFKKRDLSKYFASNPNFAGEVTGSGEQRVVMGVFRDYWEADTFKKQLRELGIRDAWIVPFKDGKRVDIKEVMSGISGESDE